MERILQRWYDMISINSVNGHEAAMADYVANVLREIGMDPHYSYFDEDTARERPSLWTADAPARRSCLLAIWIPWASPTAGIPTPSYPRRSMERYTAGGLWT